MKNKGFLKNILGLAIILVMGVYVTGCGNDDLPPAPTLKMNVTVDGFTVHIAAEATDADTWLWEYGDGTQSDSVGSHTHTYAQSGTYTIICTVTGEGGSETKSESVTIATIEELLTAHAWKMSDAGNNGLGYHITTDLTIDQSAPNVLAIIDQFQNDTLDLNPDYDYTVNYADTYTFNSNKSMNINNDGDALVGWIYADQNFAFPDDYVSTCRYVGINVVKYLVGDTATWEAHENSDLNLETVYAPDPNNPLSGGVAETVEFKDVDYIKFSNGGYLGFLDYTPEVIINSITDKELVVTLFYNGYLGDPQNDNGLYLRPSFLVRMTFIAE